MAGDARRWSKALGWALAAAVIVAAALGCYLFAYTPIGYVSESVLLADGPALNAEQARLLAGDCAQWVGEDALLAPLADVAGVRASVRQIPNTSLLTLRVAANDEKASVYACNLLAKSLTEYARTRVSYATLTVDQPAVAAHRNLRENIAAIGHAFCLCFVATALIALPLCKPRFAERGFAAEPLLARFADQKAALRAFSHDSNGAPLYRFIGRETLEELRALALCVRRIGRERPVRSLVVASREPDEDKSAVCALLASELCAEGSRVLCVDMDCFTPTLGGLLRTRGTRDLEHYLRGEAPLNQVVLSTPIKGLYLIDQCHRASSATRLAVSEGFQSFLNRACEEFDYILFDTPPVSLFADASALSCVAEGTLLVMADGRWTESEQLDTARRFRRMDCPLLGTVSTMNPARRERRTRNDDDRV